MRLMQRLYDRLSRMPHVQLYTGRPDGVFMRPFFFFNVRGMESEEAGQHLSARGSRSGRVYTARRPPMRLWEHWRTRRVGLPLRVDVGTGDRHFAAAVAKMSEKLKMPIE